MLESRERCWCVIITTGSPGGEKKGERMLRPERRVRQAERGKERGRGGIFRGKSSFSKKKKGTPAGGGGRHRCHHIRM